MKKKIVAFMLVIAMLAICFGATLAYFTDADAEKNTFTVGSVKIDLIESTLHRADWGKGEFSDEEIIADAAKYQEYLAAQELMPGVAINKMPYVVNTGKSDAYIRIRVMIPSALDLEVLNSSMYCSSALEKEFTTDVDWANPDSVVVEMENGDEVEFDVYEFTRVKPLTSGEMTYWNVWNTIAMDADTTQEEVEALIAAGAITAEGQFNVLVQADAIQAASFESAAEAFAAFDAQ